jgi:hypothetical protein
MDIFVRPKLIRQTNDFGDLSGDPPEPCPPRPLVWSSKENPEYVWGHPPADAPEEFVPSMPDGIQPNSSYPANSGISVAELVDSLQESFNAAKVTWFRQEKKYRWDVRTYDTFSGIGIDIRIFQEKGKLCVHFQKHYGDDNWKADELIDEIASKAKLDMTISINPWKQSEFVPF